MCWARIFGGGNSSAYPTVGPIYVQSTTTAFLKQYVNHISAACHMITSKDAYDYIMVAVCRCKMAESSEDMFQKYGDGCKTAERWSESVE